MKHKHTPPKGAQRVAQKVLNWREKYPNEIRGMTRVGWIRANQLASGKPLSDDIVNRMYRFKRHEKNKSVKSTFKRTPWKDAGKVAWDGWGGDIGINWAKRIVKRERK